jgi:ATP synthase protein I
VEKKEDKSTIRLLMRASTVGIHLVVCTFVGLAIGVLLDRVFGTKPWLTLVFLLVGIATGFRELVRMAKEDDNNKKSV